MLYHPNINEGGVGMSGRAYFLKKKSNSFPHKPVGLIYR